MSVRVSVRVSVSVCREYVLYIYNDAFNNKKETNSRGTKRRKDRWIDRN